MIAKYIMDVYPRALYVAIGETTKSLNEYFKNDPDVVPEISDNSNGYCCKITDGEHGGALIRFDTLDEINNALIAHECLHAVMYYCIYLGMYLDDYNNNEHLAYLLQWCVDKVDKAIVEYNELHKPCSNPDYEQSVKTI